MRMLELVPDPGSGDSSRRQEMPKPEVMSLFAIQMTPGSVSH